LIEPIRVGNISPHLVRRSLDWNFPDEFQADLTPATRLAQLVLRLINSLTLAT
jgi:hypothetical protein